MLDVQAVANCQRCSADVETHSQRHQPCGAKGHQHPAGFCPLKPSFHHSLLRPWCLQCFSHDARGNHIAQANIDHPTLSACRAKLSGAGRLLSTQTWALMTMICLRK